MGDSSDNVTAAVLLIGNEILSGRTQDKNLAHIGKVLDEVGVRLLEARVVADIHEDIIAALDALRERYDYVFTTGGIGPTHDDITTAAIAAAFGLPVVRSRDAIERMERYYKTTDITEARLKMADVPEGAELIDNVVSGAPGYRVDNVFVMAGIPKIMQAMLDAIRHQLQGGEPMLSRALALYLRESVIAAGLESLQERYPQVAIGSYPFAREDRFGAQVVARGTDADELDRLMAEVRTLADSLDGDVEEV